MHPQLKGRTIFSITSSGEHSEITIRLEFGPDEIVDLGDNSIVQLRGHAFIDSNWYRDHVQTAAFDEQQTIASLMHIVGTCLLSASKNTDRVLFTVTPDRPVKEPFDIFL